MKNNLIIIGGSDPSGGAGIQADLRTLFGLELEAKCVVTSVTAQNEKKFISYESVSSKNFSDQLRAVEKWLNDSIVKIGMIGNSQHLKTLFTWLEKSRSTRVILDPVLLSSTGAKLIDNKGLDLLLKFLPSLYLLTPNLSEAEKLSGIKIRNKQDKLKVGERLLKMGAQNILLKDGHGKGKKTCDILFSQEMNYFFEDSRIKNSNVHGTGCTLASAIAGHLSLENSLVDSIIQARKIVRKKIKSHQ